MRIVLISAMFALVANGAHADQAADRAAIMRTYDDLKASLAQGSFQPIRNAMAPRLVIVKEDNATLTMTPSEVRDVSIGQVQILADVRVARLIVDADTATAIVTFDLHATKQSAQTGLPYKMETVDSVVHDWRRSADGWRIERETVIAARQIVDPESLTTIIATAIEQHGGGGGGGAGQEAIARGQSAADSANRYNARMDQIMTEQRHARSCMAGIGYECGN